MEQNRSSTSDELNPQQMPKVFRRVFIGHRGVGKTSLLRRHQAIFSKVEHFDLDAEIAKKEQKSVSDIFKEHGEQYFRQLEKFIFLNLIKKDQVVISVGGGFDPKLIADDIEVIWVRRDTDKDGRIFLNRPGLLKNLDPLTEFEKLFKSRTPAFEQRANWVYDVPEGIELSKLALTVEQKILCRQWKNLDIIITLNQRNKIYFTNAPAVEIRDDQFDYAELEGLFNLYRKSKIIFSFRKKQEEDISKIYNEILRISHQQRCSEVIFDWALELGEPFSEWPLNQGLLSIHDCLSVQEGINTLSKYTSLYYKLCPMVETWEDLFLGYSWQQADPKHRFFLPRSKNGRWKWFRQLNFRKHVSTDLKLGFVRQMTNIQDQPTLFDVLLDQEKIQSGFWAVLGSPVHHSQSPMLHADFVKQPFYAIDIYEQEFIKAFEILDEWGLKAAAVTSPLKKVAAHNIIDTESYSEINTLLKNDLSWIGTSTDHFGFSKLLEQATKEDLTLNQEEGLVLEGTRLSYEHTKPLSNKTIVIWGGSGVLPALLKVVPQAICFSSRTGEVKINLSKIDKNTSLTKDNEISLKSNLPTATIQPDVLIWAAPRSAETRWPEQCGYHWSPQYIIDLNYTDHSMGLEYAQKKTVPYISGIEMLKEQGLEQQKFWKRFL